MKDVQEEESRLVCQSDHIQPNVFALERLLDHYTATYKLNTCYPHRPKIICERCEKKLPSPVRLPILYGIV